MSEDVTAAQLAAARTEGEVAATATAESAPTHPLLRVAWARGFGKVDQLQEAIDAAKAAGCTWKDIGDAVDENWKTAATKYGGGRERQRAYRKRKQAEGD